MKLALRDVAIGYDKDKLLQKFVNFTVQTGEVCCVLGPNGCGKTTLIKTILGMQPLFDGRITVDGDDVTKWGASRLSDTMAYVAQRHEQSFPFQVKDVVMLGRINKVRALAERGLAVMMITHNPDHAFMTGAQVALFFRHETMKFGDAYAIITRENIQDAYGTKVKIVEFTHENQEIMRMCAPEFGGRRG